VQAGYCPKTKMIQIAVRQSGIEIIGESQNPVFSGTHRAYFETILNFRRRVDGQGYDWNGSERIADQVRDICDYLHENKLDYKLDEQATRILDRARGAETRLASAIAAGREVQASDPTIAPTIPGLQRELRPHQYVPVRHLIAVPNAANFSVPGAGKTSVVLAAFRFLRLSDQVDCLLVIGPGSSFLAWEEETTNTLGNDVRVVRLTGSPEGREVAYDLALSADVSLITYQTANNDRARLIRLMRSRRVMLVLDESHYVKGAGAFASTVLELAPEAIRRVVLTGTPMPNGYIDLWTQASFLWPEQHLFGNRTQFRTLIGTPDGQQQARDKLRPLFTRVRKSDLGLPGQRYIRETISMGPQQERIYKILAARTLNDFKLLPSERLVVHQWRRARMVRLLQAASNPALLAQPSIEFSLPPEEGFDLPILEVLQKFLRYEMPRKILAAAELARRILRDPSEKVVVWTHFVRNIQLLLELLKDYLPLPLYGAVPRDGPDEEEYTREQHVRTFRADPSHRIMVANPGAAAESISLHRVSHHAIYLERTFNAGQFIQSRERIHRVGLERHEEVTYHLLISQGTIDETVDARLAAKEQRMMDVLDDPDLPVAELDIYRPPVRPRRVGRRDRLRGSYGTFTCGGRAVTQERIANGNPHLSAYFCKAGGIQQTLKCRSGLW
jgi:SNF2 family DNA or RNA helicase